MCTPEDPSSQGEAETYLLPGIFRRWTDSFLASHVVTPAQRKALEAVRDCRTVALGGHILSCEACGEETRMYNSCGDRHCPVCQGRAQQAWIAARLERVLPTYHFHVVFTLPEALRRIAIRNPARVYGLMMRAAYDVLELLAGQRLGAQLGVTEVLHTWTREMSYHPHVHCVVTGGGLNAETHTWVATTKRFLFPVAVMRKLFRGKVRAGLAALHKEGKLDLGGACKDLQEKSAFRALLYSLSRTEWVVYSKRPFAGAKHVYSYLGRYTHRVAISNSRILAVREGSVTFRTRGKDQITLTPEEFIRRFSLHVLPAGFHKIRHFGLYSGTNVGTRLVVARGLLPVEAQPTRLAVVEGLLPVEAQPTEIVHDVVAAVEERLVDGEIPRIRCPRCGSERVIVTEIARPERRVQADTS